MSILFLFVFANIHCSIYSTDTIMHAGTKNLTVKLMPYSKTFFLHIVQPFYNIFYQLVKSKLLSVFSTRTEVIFHYTNLFNLT